jgi:hypothetical protein
MKTEPQPSTKSSTKPITKVTRGFVTEIVNENYVAADKEIITETPFKVTRGFRRARNPS